MIAGSTHEDERSGVTPRPATTSATDFDWVGALRSTGATYDQAVARLHELLLRATRHQVSRMPEAAGLGTALREEIIHSSADQATLSVLGELESFEGRSKFTTWAYKFGILQAGVEVRRSVWRDRDIRLSDVPEPRTGAGTSPESHVEAGDLAAAVRSGLEEALTGHQRKIAVARLIDEIPIDVLAEHLGTTRNALYKTLHDARKRLRAYLSAQGFDNPDEPITTEEVTR